MTGMEIIFLFSLWSILYVYLIYPVLVFIFSLFYRPVVRVRGYRPTVSVILSAYNEELYIEQKIISLLAQAYSKEQMEILVGSDGSTDHTDEIILRYKDSGVKYFRQALRSGKPAMLNLLVRQAKGEVLVFIDARQGLEENAIAELVSNLVVSDVGSVSGQLVFRKEKQIGKAGDGVGLYWQYEKLIRYCESRTGSMLGATGAFYAIRRELYTPLPEDIVLDDVYIPLTIALKGYRAVYDEEARIYDNVSANAQNEFARKTRTLAGNYQLLKYIPGLLNPFRGRIYWQFFSHKLLRLIVPFLLIALLISNVFILDYFIYRVIFILQFVLYFLAVLGVTIKRPNRFTDVPAMFCVMNAAALAGAYRFLTQRQDVKWERTDR